MVGLGSDAAMLGGAAAPAIQGSLLTAARVPEPEGAICGPGVPRCREPERALRTAEHRSIALGGGSLRGLRRRLGPSFISAAEMEREHARNRVGIGMCPSRVRVAWQRAVRQGKGGSCEGLPWDGEQTRRGYRTRE